DEEEMFENPTPANFDARKKITARNKAPLNDDIKERLKEASSFSDVKAILGELKAKQAAEEEPENDKDEKLAKKSKSTPAKEKKARGATKKTTPAKKK